MTTDPQRPPARRRPSPRQITALAFSQLAWALALGELTIARAERDTARTDTAEARAAVHVLHEAWNVDRRALKAAERAQSEQAVEPRPTTLPYKYPTVGEQRLLTKRSARRSA